MASKDIELRKTNTIFDELERLHNQISQRAYELFRQGGSFWGSSLADWMNAERELVWKPAIEVRQKGNQFEVLAAVPGVEAKDLDVEVTPEDILIKADIHHEHTAEEGTVHHCEFSAGRLCRSIHLPEKIDPGSAKAEYRNGMLYLTAAAAVPAVRKVAVRTA